MQWLTSGVKMKLLIVLIFILFVFAAPVLLIFFLWNCEDIGIEMRENKWNYKEMEDNKWER
jgi:hypothetical protein